MNQVSEVKVEVSEVKVPEVKVSEDRIQRHKDKIHQLLSEIKDIITTIPRDMKTGRLRTLNVRRKMEHIMLILPCNEERIILIVEPFVFRTKRLERIIETFKFNINLNGKYMENYIECNSTDTTESILERFNEDLPAYQIERFWMKMIKPAKSFMKETKTGWTHNWTPSEWEWK